jgi:predicted nuclease of predicted toxin-antitoxin system
MTHLKIDENLPAKAATLLVDAGHDAMTVNEQGLGGSDDATIGRVCHAEGRAIVTLDRGFGDPRRHPTAGTPGIVVLRPRSQDAPAVLHLVGVLSHLLQDRSVKNALWILGPDQLRTRSVGTEEL